MSHPNAFALQRYAADDLAPAEHERTREHVARCEACAHALAGLEAARERFLAANPAEEVLRFALRESPPLTPSEVEGRAEPSAGERRAEPTRGPFIPRVEGSAEHRPPSTSLGANGSSDAPLGGTERPSTSLGVNGGRLRAFAALGAVAASALIALFAFPDGPVRLKGLGVAVHRQRGAEIRPLGEGDTVAAGDALRLVVTVPRPGRYMAWVVDAHGRVDRAVDAPQELAAGAHALPGSVVVEAPCVSSRVVVERLALPLEEAEAGLRERVRAGALTGVELSCE